MKALNRVDLVGDGIENPYNVQAMIDAATMFNATCFFRESAGLDVGEAARNTTCLDLTNQYPVRLALDNWKNAQVLYGFELPSSTNACLIAGNERHGLSRSMQETATAAICIPMISRQLNCINVAAASAVALYYLSHGLKGKMMIRSEPQKRRPELIMLAGKDHAELGSSIRSAAAFGWNRVFVEDPFAVWFGCDRIIKSEGRAAARRGRNSIRIIPCKRDYKYLFREAVLVTCKQEAPPITKVDLARGSDQVIVIADETESDTARDASRRIAEKVSLARIDLPASRFPYRLRHMASIALAEVSRQVGQKALWQPSKQLPLHESALKILSDTAGEDVSIAELEQY